LLVPKRHLIAVALTCGIATLAFAQQSPEAALAEAVRLEQAAVAAYPPGKANIGQAVWAAAARAAEEAVAANPDSPEAMRLRARVYTQVGFWAKADEAWRSYLSKVGENDPKDRAEYANVQYQLGYSALTRGLLDEATRRLDAAIQYAPQNARYQAWRGRLELQRGNARAATPFWEAALRLDPNDKSAAYFLNVSRRTAEFGPEATSALYRGQAALELGQAAVALAAFREAVVAAPNSADAQRSLGRSALDAGLGSEAVTAFEALVRLEGASPENQYLLNYAREVAAVGLPATKAFRQGYSLYQAGDKAGAASQFLAATTANGRYQKAWAWLGRVRYESGDWQGALDAYGQATALDPNDKASAHFVRLAQSKLR
jgi:tetratricopeptide (TPR) repeat protein